MKFSIILLSLALIAPSSIFENRARAYLDPSIEPRPKPFEGEAPHFERFTFRSQKCWGVKSGVVCSACYNHPDRLYGQATVLCPWDRNPCRYVVYPEEQDKFGVDYNQCIVK